MWQTISSFLNTEFFTFFHTKRAQRTPKMLQTWQVHIGVLGALLIIQKCEKLFRHNFVLRVLDTLLESPGLVEENCKCMMLSFFFSYKKSFLWKIYIIRLLESYICVWVILTLSLLLRECSGGSRIRRERILFSQTNKMTITTVLYMTVHRHETNMHTDTIKYITKLIKQSKYGLPIETSRLIWVNKIL